MTSEIPRQEWGRFLDEFSRRHAGWLVTIERSDPGKSPQALARDVPLAGITAEFHGDHPRAIEIIAGPRDGEINHRIAEPTRLSLSRTPEGADESIEAESADQTRTLVRFRSAVLPEMVDGLLPER